MPNFSPATTNHKKIEPRCLVCQSKHRDVIDHMLVSGASFSDIEREYADSSHPVPRRSVSRHAKEHLGYQDAALRRILENKAKAANIDVETATRRIITREAYLEVVIEKGFDALISGQTELAIKDIIKAIEVLDKYKQDASFIEVDHLKRQYQAFVTAVKENVPSSLWTDIVSRTEQLFENADDKTPYELQPPPDANVVEDTGSDNAEDVDGESTKISGSGDDPEVPPSLDSPESI